MLGAFAAGGFLGAAPGSSERLLAAAVPACHGGRRGGPCSGGFEAGKRAGFGCWGGGDTPQLGGFVLGRTGGGRPLPPELQLGASNGGAAASHERGGLWGP